MELANQYGLIIAGAGGPSAGRMAGGKDISVLSLQSGDKRGHVRIHSPAGYLHCIDSFPTCRQPRTQTGGDSPSKALKPRQQLFHDAANYTRQQNLPKLMIAQKAAQLIDAAGKESGRQHAHLT